MNFYIVVFYKLTDLFHLLGEQGVVGSNPTAPTTIKVRIDGTWIFLMKLAVSNKSIP
jgi:hypothetical protein